VGAIDFVVAYLVLLDALSADGTQILVLVTYTWTKKLDRATEEIINYNNIYCILFRLSGLDSQSRRCK
jgi:hypothetical protein